MSNKGRPVSVGSNSGKMLSGPTDTDRFSGENRDVVATLQFAGAYNPLYLIRNDELIEIEANRFAIGGFSEEAGRRFVDHTVEIKKGDVIYLFSDGYADQLGVAKGRKFMKRRLK